MKRITTVGLIALLMVTMSLHVFAASGGFLDSPSVQGGPTLIEGAITGCDGEIILIPYSDCHELTEGNRKQIEDAYNQIRDNKDLSKLCPALKDIAEKNKDSVKRYAVSELFNIGYTGCDDHDDHNNFRAVLKPASTKNYVALLTLVNGVWTVVEDVEVDGEHLIVSGNYYGPYVIVVDTGSGATGDSFPWIYVVLMCVSAAGLVALAIVYKKRKAA